MDLTSTFLLPSSLDKLWRLFGDPRFVHRRQLVLGAEAVALRRFVATPRHIEMEAEREVPVAVETVPSWLHTWFGSRQTLRERSEWRRVGSRRIAVETAIEPVGQPVAIHGRGWFTEPIHGIVRMRVDWQVSSSLTALGDQVERLHVDQLWSMLRRERAFTLRYAAHPDAERCREAAAEPICQ